MFDFVTDLWHKTWFYQKYVEIKKKIFISIVVLIIIIILYKIFKIWMQSRKSD